MGRSDKKYEYDPCEGISQTLVWGKQSVWLSACRTPPLKGAPGGSPDPLNNTYETEELNDRKPTTKPNIDRPAYRR